MELYQHGFEKCLGVTDWKLLHQPCLLNPMWMSLFPETEMPKQTKMANKEIKAEARESIWGRNEMGRGYSLCNKHFVLFGDTWVACKSLQRLTLFYMKCLNQWNGDEVQDNGIRRKSRDLYWHRKRIIKLWNVIYIYIYTVSYRSMYPWNVDTAWPGLFIMGGMMYFTRGCRNNEAKQSCFLVISAEQAMIDYGPSRPFDSYSWAWSHTSIYIIYTNIEI